MATLAKSSSTDAYSPSHLVVTPCSDQSHLIKHHSLLFGIHDAAILYQWTKRAQLNDNYELISKNH